MMRKIGGIAFGIALMLVLGGCDGKQKAKEELEQKGISYSQESFAKSIVSNNKDVVELFFKAGIDLNTPEILEALVNSDDMGIIKKALESGLNPNAKANGVPLIVMLVVDKKNNPKLKDLLEDKNLNINLQVEKDYKPFLATSNALLLSAVKNNLGAFEMLIKKGADTKMTYTLGKTEILKTNISGVLLAFSAEDFATTGGKEEAPTADADTGAPYTGIPAPILSEENIGQELRNLKMLKMIPNLDVNVKVNFHGEEMNLLHLASGQHQVEIVRFLLDKGANTNVVIISTKTTPLMVVYHKKDIDTKKAETIEKLLITKGANQSLKDVNGNTFKYYKKLVKEESIATVGNSITAFYNGTSIDGYGGYNMLFSSKKNGGTIYKFLGDGKFESKLKIGQSYVVYFDMIDDISVDGYIIKIK